VAETLKKGTRVTGADRSKLATALVRRYDSGESIRSLAAATGRSYGFVHRILTETGVTLRGRGGATRSGRGAATRIRKVKVPVSTRSRDMKEPFSAMPRPLPARFESDGKTWADNTDQVTAGQFNDEVSLLPVTIYLVEVEGHERVQSAVENLLAASGLSIDGREDPVIGSWFRRMSATVTKAAKSPAAREEALALKHVLDQQIVLGRDADITNRLLQNLGPVIASLQSTKDAVIRVGAILIVKVDWVVVILQLTAAQQAVLDHQPDLASAPHEILRALKASVDVNGSYLEQSKRLAPDN
jgi:hypothetical protein